VVDAELRVAMGALIDDPKVAPNNTAPLTDSVAVSAGFDETFTYLRAPIRRIESGECLNRSRLNESRRGRPFDRGLRNIDGAVRMRRWRWRRTSMPAPPQPRRSDVRSGYVEG
jgi:hypothetical protein